MTMYVYIVRKVSVNNIFRIYDKTNVKFWKVKSEKKLIIMIKQSILHWVKYPKNSEPEWREIRD